MYFLFGGCCSCQFLFLSSSFCSLLLGFPSPPPHSNSYYRLPRPPLPEASVSYSSLLHLQNWEVEGELILRWGVGLQCWYNNEVSKEHTTESISGCLRARANTTSVYTLFISKDLSLCPRKLSMLNFKGRHAFCPVWLNYGLLKSTRWTRSSLGPCLVDPWFKLQYHGSFRSLYLIYTEGVLFYTGSGEWRGEVMFK